MARWAAMLQICSSELQGYREIAWANSIDSKSDKIKVDRRQRNRAQIRPPAKEWTNLIGIVLIGTVVSRRGSCSITRNGDQNKISIKRSEKKIRWKKKKLRNAWKSLAGKHKIA